MVPRRDTRFNLDGLACLSTRTQRKDQRVNSTKSALGRTSAGFGVGIALIATRLLAVFVTAALIWIGLGGWASGAGFPPSGTWAPLGLLPVNVLCIWLLVRRIRAQGLTLWEALGVERGRVWRDVRRGALCVLVLGVPFLLTIAVSVLVMYGAGAPRAFESMLLDASSLPAESPTPLLVLAVLSVVPFIVTNAPAEELVYRGYGMTGVAGRWGSRPGIAATSLLFGLQHIVFAASVPGMIVYFLAFAVWGAMAALVVRAEGRLFPVVISHWIVNAGLSIPGLLIPAARLAGLSE